MDVKRPRTGVQTIGQIGLVFALWGGAQVVLAEELRVAVFQADATPPVGSPLSYAPVRIIEDRLSARGVVLLGAGEPLVLCAVDWLGIRNGAYDAWRAHLAQAAGTTPARVAVHALHQHAAPDCDFDAARLLAAHDPNGLHYDVIFERQTLQKVGDAIRTALKNPRRVTHLGTGKAVVEKVASSRRLLGADGKVQFVRMSTTKDPQIRNAPEGLIDPWVRLVSLWEGDQPIVVLSYYATHPQSFYQPSDVTADFVGLARAQRERELHGTPHLHFNGAGGNITVGKYNQGVADSRTELAARLAEGLRKAWEATKKTPLRAEDVQWRTHPVPLPPAEHLQEKALRAKIADQNVPSKLRRLAATSLAFLLRQQAGQLTDLSCLRMKHVHLLHMPGELFVEYQLAAQQLRPQDFVCLAAYGDSGPIYIGTAAAYAEGGYEVSPAVSNVSPAVEQVLINGMRVLLK